MIFKTKIKQFGDYENDYFLDEFDSREPPSEPYAGPMWRHILREIWSFIW